MALYEVNFTLVLSLDTSLVPVDESPMLWSSTQHVPKARYLMTKTCALTLIILLLVCCSDFVGANESVASNSEKTSLGTEDCAKYEEEEGAAVLSPTRLQKEFSDWGNYWSSPLPHKNCNQRKRSRIPPHFCRRRSSRSSKPPDHFIPSF
jgi:hypothetical protein